MWKWYFMPLWIVLYLAVGSIVTGILYAMTKQHEFNYKDHWWDKEPWALLIPLWPAAIIAIIVLSFRGLLGFTVKFMLNGRRRQNVG